MIDKFEKLMAGKLGVAILMIIIFGCGVVF